MNYYKRQLDKLKKDQKISVKFTSENGKTNNLLLTSESIKIIIDWLKSQLN
jgi:hypothetical protein